MTLPKSSPMAFKTPPEWFIDSVHALYAEEIEQSDADYLTSWILNCRDNFESAKLYIRELQCNQAYDTSGMLNLALRKLMDDTFDMRDSSRTNSPSPVNESNAEVFDLHNVFAEIEHEAPKVNPISPATSHVTARKHIDLIEASKDLSLPTTPLAPPRTPSSATSRSRNSSSLFGSLRAKVSFRNLRPKSSTAKESKPGETLRLSTVTSLNKPVSSIHSDKSVSSSSLSNSDELQRTQARSAGAAPRKKPNLHIGPSTPVSSTRRGHATTLSVILDKELLENGASGEVSVQMLPLDTPDRPAPLKSSRSAKLSPDPLYTPTGMGRGRRERQHCAHSGELSLDNTTADGTFKVPQGVIQEDEEHCGIDRASNQTDGSSGTAQAQNHLCRYEQNASHARQHSYRMPLDDMAYNGCPTSELGEDAQYDQDQSDIWCDEEDGSFYESLYGGSYGRVVYSEEGEAEKATTRPERYANYNNGDASPTQLDYFHQPGTATGSNNGSLTSSHEDQSVTPTNNYNRRLSYSTVVSATYSAYDANKVFYLDRQLAALGTTRATTSTVATSTNGDRIASRASHGETRIPNEPLPGLTDTPETGNRTCHALPSGFVATILSLTSVFPQSPGDARTKQLARDLSNAAKAYMEDVIVRAREAVADVPTIDWVSLSSADRFWRTTNESILVAIYGANDTELSDTDINHVNRIATALNDGVGDVPGFKWMEELFSPSN